MCVWFQICLLCALVNTGYRCQEVRYAGSDCGDQRAGRSKAKARVESCGSEALERWCWPRVCHPEPGENAWRQRARVRMPVGSPDYPNSIQTDSSPGSSPRLLVSVYMMNHFSPVGHHRGLHRDDGRETIVKSPRPPWPPFWDRGELRATLWFIHPQN